MIKSKLKSNLDKKLPNQLFITAPLHEALIVSDLHFTDSIYDEYKWQLFPWIKELLSKTHINNLLILGDIFDRKDRHPAKLVNRFIEELQKLTASSSLHSIIILKGNHDYLKPDEPFLEFIKTLDKIFFIKHPTTIIFDDAKTLWLPHTRTPEEEWKQINFTDSNLQYVFFHQSVIGAKVSNFFEMKEGLDKNIFSGTKARLLSGDIHVPQHIPITNTPYGMDYIGTPYPVAFGDNYKPRAILLRNKEIIEIPNTKTIQKVTLYIKNNSELEDYELNENDQLKLVFVLSQEELADWNNKKQAAQAYCQKRGFILRDIRFEKESSETSETILPVSKIVNQSPKEIFTAFIELEELDEETIKAGMELLNE